MRPHPLTLAATLALASFAPTQTQAQSQPTLLILSKQAHTLALVDPTTLHITATLPVGPDPHEVIASADGTRAWVSNYGFGSLHTLAVLDLTHRRALPSIDLGPLSGPHGLAFTAGKVWFTAEGAKAIGSLNPTTGKVDWILGTGQNRTHMIHVSPDARHIITTNVSSATVSLIDQVELPMGPPPPPPSAASQPAPQPPSNQPHTRTDWNETVIPVGHGSEGFDLSPDGKEAWVANAGDGTISIIDLGSKQVVATLQANVAGANRLKFTPDGRHVLVSTLAGPDLVILDPHTRAVTKRLPIGHGAAGILIEPSGHRAFVSCSPDNYVAVIDLGTLTVTGHIAAGDEPDGLAWSPNPQP